LLIFFSSPEGIAERFTAVDVSLATIPFTKHFLKSGE